MFKLTEVKGYWYPVHADVIDAEGKKEKVNFDAQFKNIEQEELDGMLGRTGGDEPIKDNEIVERVFLGWRKVQDADGNELAVNDENRETLLAIRGIRKQIVLAWLKSIGLEGKAKN